ncbi:MAG: hypothetical protein U0Q16_33240 [Bryobacteraceae bacterium]
MRSALLAPVVVALTGCGYVGPPLPPSLHIPMPVADLAARQVSGRVEIHFTAPKETTDRVPIQRLSAIELKMGETMIPVASLKPGPVEATAEVGALAGKTVTVAVRTASLKQKWSDWRQVEIELAPALATPAAARAESHPRGVRLAWDSAGPLVRVWKRATGREAFLAVAEVSGNEWIDADAPFGTPQAYRLQSIAKVSGGEAESERTEVIEITPEDKFPPAPPKGLTAVTGINAIELAWDRSPEPDVVAYVVYRAVGDGAMAKHGDPGPAASFSDRDVKAGVRYRYRVTAVDARGNESGQSDEAELVAQ